MHTQPANIELLQLDSISVALADIGKDLPSAGNSDRIFALAEKVLADVMGIWRPRALYRRLSVKQKTSDRISLFAPDSPEAVTLSLGNASCFMAYAEQAMAGVYTIGRELADWAATASSRKQVMDAYLCDIIGLAVLKKVEHRLTSIAEEMARQRGWGVSPLLSPGSVHGWDLADQVHLVSLLPLEHIDVQISESGTFTPFTTVSFLIGIGRKFSSTLVGSTCAVCSRRKNCAMNHGDKQ